MSNEPVELFELLTFPVAVIAPVTPNVEPSKVRLASPFKASADENVAILLFEPFATAETAPLPPPPAAAIVTLSPLASVVNVTFEPATKVRVSVDESATTLDCPETAIVENAF